MNRELGAGIGDLNHYSGLNIDGCELLHMLGHRVDVDDALVDPHLKRNKWRPFVNTTVAAYIIWIG